MAGRGDFLGNASEWINKFGNWKTKRDRINNVHKIDKAISNADTRTLSDVVSKINAKHKNRQDGA